MPRDTLLALRAAAAPLVNEDGSIDIAAAPAAAPDAALRSLLGAQDLSRLLALTAAPGDAAAAGSEEPYDPAAGELVVMLAAAVDGLPPVLGADVLERAPRGGLRTKGLPEEEEEA